jgi:hypothetical protein
MLRLGFCAGLFPGCATTAGDRAIYPDRPAAPGPREPAAASKDDATAAYVRPQVRGLPPSDPLAAIGQLGSPYNAFPDGYLHTPPPAVAASQTKTAQVYPDLSEQASTPEFKLWPNELPKIGGAEAQLQVEAHAPAAPPREPLLQALECFLNNEPDRALDLLKKYNQSSQDVYICLLPVLAQLTHKGVDQLSREEVTALHEQLYGLLTSLRARARLVIDKACFCAHVQCYGVFQPLPGGHAFRARSSDQPGDQVQLYVELRNFCTERCPDGYLTRLSSSVELCDAAGQQVWYHAFTPEQRLCRQSPWQDCCGNYRFTVPHVPPGTYTHHPGQGRYPPGLPACGPPIPRIPRGLLRRRACSVPAHSL